MNDHPIRTEARHERLEIDGDRTEAEIAVVLEERHSLPTCCIRERMNVVWLFHKGTSREDAVHFAGVSRRTVQRVVRTFRQNRPDGVRK